MHIDALLQVHIPGANFICIVRRGIPSVSSKGHVQMSACRAHVTCEPATKDLKSAYRHHSHTAVYMPTCKRVDVVSHNNRGNCNKTTLQR